MPSRGLKQALVVGDDPGLVTILASIVRDEGCPANTAPSGAEALAKSRQTSFDLLITGLIVPGMTGPELIRVIRQRSPRIRVILVARNPSLAQHELVQNLNLSGFLSQPLDAGRFAAMVRAMLARER